MKKKFWKNHRVFITGNTGLLGYWVTKYLVESGASVTALVHSRVPRPFIDTFSKADVIKGSIIDYKKILSILKKKRIETVFHLAAQTISPTANKNPIFTFETNIEGTWVILEACRQVKSIERIIIASSDKAYAEDEKLPYTEKSRLAGIRPYSVSKTCADYIASAYYHSYNLPLCITRCGNFFGGGDLLFSRLAPSVIRSGLLNKELIIRSDGKFERDFFYVEDGMLATVQLAEKMSQNKKIIGEAFNFSYGEPIRVLDFVQKILDRMGSKTRPRVLNQATNEIRSQYMSADKAKKILGWKPQYTLDMGIDKTVDWYKELFNDKRNIKIYAKTK